MAGSAHFPAKTSGRKQWDSFEEPMRGCLLRSGVQSAENGCSESQVLLAKELLNHPWDKEGNAWSNKDARQAVYWLIKASEQGSKEATEILQKCLVTGQGITEVNILDVKRCLNMKDHEKAARRSAQKIFNDLSAGDDFITTEQLRRAMLESLDYEEGADTDTVRAGPSVSPADTEDHAIGEKLTEDHLVTAAVEYSRGELPFVHRLLNVVPVNQCGPPQVLTRGYDILLEILGRRPPFFPAPQMATTLQIFAALAIYSIWESIDMYAILPPVLYYCSLAAMVIFSCQMLQGRRDFRQFNCWSGLFWKNDYYLRNIEEAEHQFYRNNIQPYGNFFVALVINLMTYPLVTDTWVPHSELTILAISFTFLTLFAFLGVNHKKEFLMSSSRYSTTLHLLSFTINVLAMTMDTVVTQILRYFDVRLPTFPPYTVGNGVEFCLSFRAVFHLMMPALFLRMAHDNEWRGTYQIMIPHCITLAWWQITILAARNSCWYGLARSAVALLGSVVLLPLAGITSMVVALAAAVRYLTTDPPVLTQIAITAALASLGLLTILWVQGRGATAGTFRAKLAKVSVCFRVLLVASVVLLWASPALVAWEGSDFHPINPSEGAPSGVQINHAHAEPLSWEQFHSNCHHPAWENGNEAQTQMLCSQLEGVPVKWDGYVHSVRIKKIVNPWREVIKRLPSGLGHAMACAVSFFSEKESLDPCTLELNRSPSEEQRCRQILDWARLGGKRKCSLNEWNRYMFEIEVRMKLGLWSSTSVPVILHAGDHFRNWTSALRAGDHVWFSGTLVNAPHWKTDSSNNILGGSNPQVSLVNAGCLVCWLNAEPVTQPYYDGISLRDILNFITVGSKSVLNFVFNPVVIFK